MKATNLFGYIFLAFILISSEARALEPLYDGVGSYTRKISTKSVEAQKYFDQGINFYFGFNHGAALRAFQAAETMDPDCAMNYWGAALACGGDINFPGLSPEMADLAWKQMQLAREHAVSASPVEQALIEALASRYAEHQPDDRSSLDLAYAEAMRTVWKKYPDDPDVGSLFAEAAMMGLPGDPWTPDGKPAPWTDEILAALETVFNVTPEHPFANHLYIHALEASTHPERALAAADRLRDLQPGIAHEVHMPSHIYIRVGHWEDAVTANLKAIAADSRYQSVFGPYKGPVLFYAAHNHQMLAYAAMMTGQKQLAIEHIREMIQGMPEENLKEYAAVLEPLGAQPYEVLIRFGLWDQILGEPDHPSFMVFTRAFRHAARAIAYAAKGDTKSARAEQSFFLEAAKLIPAGNKLGSESCESLLKVVSSMLNGEISVREGDIDGGLADLRKAVVAEDALKYEEPPGWMLPVRHALGANLMQASRYAEAEQVYRDDLARVPENGWSLFGLARCLQLQGKLKEASTVETRFEKIWANADMRITSSCLCQPGT